jgi:hypothetical protein
MPEVRNNGVNISYDVVGQGRPLVLLHGWCVDPLDLLSDVVCRQIARHEPTADVSAVKSDAACLPRRPASGPTPMPFAWGRTLSTLPGQQAMRAAFSAAHVRDDSSRGGNSSLRHGRDVLRRYPVADQ